MTIPHVSVDELTIVLGAGASLYDVREPLEYDSAHVGGARSGRGVEYLRSNGLDGHNVIAGTNASIESGRPTLSGRSSD